MTFSEHSDTLLRFVDSSILYLTFLHPLVINFATKLFLANLLSIADMSCHDAAPQTININLLTQFSAFIVAYPSVQLMVRQGPGGLGGGKGRCVGSL